MGKIHLCFVTRQLVVQANVNSILKQDRSKLEENGESSIGHSVSTREDRRGLDWILLPRTPCSLIICTKIEWPLRTWESLWRKKVLEVVGRGCRVERGCLVSPVGGTATTQHQRNGHNLPTLVSSLLVSCHKFLFPDRTDPGVNVKMLGGRTWLNSFVCTRVICLTAIRYNDSVNSTSLAKTVIERISWTLVSA